MSSKSPVVITGSGSRVADVLPVGHAQLRIVDALALGLALFDGLAEVDELRVGERDVRAAARRAASSRKRPRVALAPTPS